VAAIIIVCLTLWTILSRDFSQFFPCLRGGPKSGATDSWPQFCQILASLKKFTGRFQGKFAVKWILKVPPHLAYVATLPCETVKSAKQILDDKLQDSVAAYLRCGGVVNNRIKKGLLLSLLVKKFKIGEYFSRLQERTWLSRPLSSFLAVCWPGAQSAWDNHALACNFANYSPILIFFTHTLSNKPFLIWLLTTHHTLNV